MQLRDNLCTTSGAAHPNPEASAPPPPAPGTSAEATARPGWMRCTVQAVTLSKRKTNNLLTIIEMLNSSPCDVPLCTDTSRLHTGGVASVDRPSFIIQKHTLFIIWAHYYACNIFRAFCAFTFSISKMKTGTRKNKQTKNTQAPVVCLWGRNNKTSGPVGCLLFLHV